MRQRDDADAGRRQRIEALADELVESGVPRDEVEAVIAAMAAWTPPERPKPQSIDCVWTPSRKLRSQRFNRNPL